MTLRFRTCANALALALAAHGALAVDLTFSNMCVDYRLRQSVRGVELWCPGEAVARLVILGCFGASARRDATGGVVLTCGGGSTFGLR